MYTREQRQRAIDTFIRLGRSYAATVRELGYPSETCLPNWWGEYERTDGFGERRPRRKPKYDEGRRRRAVEHYLGHGRSMALTMGELGYPGGRSYLAAWIDELAPRRGPLRSPQGRVLPRPRLAGGEPRGVRGHARRLPQVVSGREAEERPGLQEPHAVPGGTWS